MVNWGNILSIFDNPMWNRIYPELSGSYPESANSKSKNPESGIGGKMAIGRSLGEAHIDFGEE